MGLERVREWKSQLHMAGWDWLRNLKPGLRALEAEEVNICLCPSQNCAGLSVPGLRDLDSESSGKAFPLSFCLAQCPQPRPWAREMLEECQDMTDSGISGTGPLLWETNQDSEPKYTSISSCYFPVEKSQTANECVSKVQIPPHYLCDCLPRPCYCSGALPASFLWLQKGTRWLFPKTLGFDE